MTDPQVKLTVRFPANLPRAIVEDRLHLLMDGALTLPAAGVVVDSWDTRQVDCDHNYVPDADGQRCENCDRVRYDAS